jgi:hypothetical protein
MRYYRKTDKPGKIHTPLSAESTAAPSHHGTGSGAFGPRLNRWIMLASCLVIGAGCAASGPSGSDPILGEIHPQKPNIYGPNPSSPAAIPTKTSANSTDPLLWSTSNSTLAPIPDSRPALAINDNIATSGFNNASFTSGFSSSSGGRPTVMPLSDQAPGAYVPGAPTSEILQAQLRARGVIWQKQESVADGVRFTCVVPNRYNPDSCKAYDATARDIVTAIQAVIVQIDRP